jgi:cyclopropane fatty-acyl-phospholipid synthase-like methyltransferase
MTRRQGSIPGSYFDDLYMSKQDPWDFQTSDYERGKYAATLAALPRSTYVNGLEIGCSIGVLTEQLAQRCGSLIATDVAETALERARRRCAGLQNVRFERLAAPSDWPEGFYDLIMLSEVVYYFDEADIEKLAGRVTGSATQGAHIMLVHWIGETDYPISGDDAVSLFLRLLPPSARVVRHDRTAKYR